MVFKSQVELKELNSKNFINLIKYSLLMLLMNV